MKIIRAFAPLFAVLLLGNANSFAQPGAAKPAPKIAPAPLDAANWRAIRVRNARPSMLAYQIDPAHNALPAFFNVPGSLADQLRQSESEIKRIAPHGVFSALQLAAADEQNLLFVAGDAEQIAQLQEFVAILDQPARTVELEAQLVELGAKDAEQFGLARDAATANAPAVAVSPPGAFSLGFVRDDFQTRLNDLVANNRARVISTQPQNIINNSSLAVSLRTGPIDNTGANQYKMPVAPAEGTDTILTLTPTINGDNTITILINTAILPANGESSGLTTIANLRDGQTIALAGLPASAFPRLTTQKVPLLNDIPLMNSTTPSSISELNQIPLIGKLFRPKKIEDERAVLLLVTARVVRADEK